MNKTRLAAFTFMVIFTFAAAHSFAYTNNDTPVEFRYLGKTNNQPVFQLDLHNSDADEFVVTLKTSSGDILYSEKVSGKDIQRKYRLNTDEMDGTSITVEISSKKNNTKTVYAVNRTTRVVEDVVINKL